MAGGRTALITGVTGQDGWHLAGLLHVFGYRVVGLIRGQSNPKRLEFLAAHPYVTLIEGDVTDPVSMARMLDAADPDELYHLAALSHVGYSFSNPTLTMAVTGQGTLNVLEAVRLTGRADTTRVYQASSSEMFGGLADNRPATGYDEESTFHPLSPYGVAKLHAHWIARNYRESYGMFVSCGIAFNHEGEHRGEEFVTRKISRAVARISLGLQDHVKLGALWPRRDWGYAGDFVEAMWRMLNHDEPDDFVLATGQSHSIEDFLAAAFACVGISDWRPYVRHDPTLIRPSEVEFLRGNPGKAERVLGWRRSVGFEELVRLMVANDLELERSRIACA